MAESHFRSAVRDFMADPEMGKLYPQGVAPMDVLEHIGDRFPLCTVIDVADELRALYGSPR